MNDYDTNDPSGLHWSDSMDEGLLTLEAELLVMSLPEPLIPRMTCLIVPELLNQLVVQWTIEHASTQTPDKSAFHRFTLPDGLDLSRHSPYETAIQVELHNLCKWLNLTRNLWDEDKHALEAA